MRKKWMMNKKVSIWTGVFTLFTLFQLVTLHKIDKFLQPPVSSMEGSTQKEQEIVTLMPPKNAEQVMYSQDKQYMAYTTKDTLTIAGKEGTIFQRTVGQVSYMQWLGNTNTLLYFVQGSYLDAYLLPLNEAKSYLIHEWIGNQRKVVNTFFSPYMEYLYIELKNGSVYEVYKYDAVSGIRQLPLGDIQISRIDYDELSDQMNITSSFGGVWRYMSDRLYRPDGSLVIPAVAVNQPNPRADNHHYLEGKKPSSMSSNEMKKSNDITSKETPNNIKQSNTTVVPPSAKTTGSTVADKSPAGSSNQVKAPIQK
ncbi:hypothetical protein DNHGIG_20740 [Collibacillus ludicampi]|uniref:Regulatory protein YycH-like domain-containing protein n=1 Tax=Collibacillus ludicampi TaxID=2771369 RepID=A0AAV4LFC4_9BACL|nr:hypothetical protein [Collibacillus ludicampi]GIM46525.1 hypothetical protein DNHGIG_20740 [Collibacillus ludicampi]